MQQINIKGKMYTPVVERVKELHKNPVENLAIETEIISDTEDKVTVKATVTVGNYTFTGHSQASWKTGMMKDVALEVAETSAVGRALGFAGIGIDTGIASADEIRKVSRKDQLEMETEEIF